MLTVHRFVEARRRQSVLPVTTLLHPIKIGKDCQRLFYANFFGYEGLSNPSLYDYIGSFTR